MCSTTPGRSPTAPRCCRAARQLDEATRIVEAARERLKGVLAIDYVVPDYYGVRPKSCMNGWGRQFLNVTPSGKARALPRRRDPAGHRLPVGARQQPGRHLVPLGRLQSLPRHRLDARAVPQLRPARDRLGRLPLPGLPADRRRGRTDPVCALSPDHGVVEAALRQAESAPRPPSSIAITVENHQL